MESVTVTAADFNGSSFDGSPFSSVPSWLLGAEKSGTLALYPDDRDYALWKVRTASGDVIAEPGDQIVHEGNGVLSVRKFG